MRQVLVLNSRFTREGFGVQADGLDLKFHGGPGDPTDPPPAEECAAAEAVIGIAAQHDIGPPSTYPRARIVLRMGVGFDNIDGALWGAAGVPLCNVPDYGTSEVADHAIALMLALCRGTATYQDRLVRDPAAGWDSSAAPLVRRLRGATFGVVGLGRIGLAAALRAKAFGMELAFYDPYAPNGFEIAVGARRVHGLHDLMSISDVLSIHAPLSDETRGMIDAAALAAAKPGLVLINTARGPIVDVGALHQALREGRIAGAGLDVLPHEPPLTAEGPSADLLRALHDGAPYLRDRLVVSPHAAFYSPDAVRDMRRKAVGVVRDYLCDGRLSNCVNSAHLRRPLR
ncbi:MAG: C-terminal binding protein [Acetobacteraceae bacterium]|nr:C-terminal binding protein [Acetobacteraceae bacterium]